VNTSKSQLVLCKVETRSRVLSDQTPCLGATNTNSRFAAR